MFLIQLTDRITKVLMVLAAPFILLFLWIIILLVIAVIRELIPEPREEVNWCPFLENQDGPDHVTFNAADLDFGKEQFHTSKGGQKLGERGVGWPPNRRPKVS